MNILPISDYGVYVLTNDYLRFTTGRRAVQRITTPSRRSRRHRIATSALALAATATLAASPLMVPNRVAEQILPQAAAALCPDGSQTCAPQPTQGGGPTQGNQVPTTAPQAPQTTVPGQAPDTGLQSPPQNGSTPTVQGNVPTMPTVTQAPDGCIVNCQSPTQAPTQAAPTEQAPTSPTQAVTQSENATQQQKCTEALAQLSSGTLPAIIGGGAGQSPVFVQLPRDPGSQAWSCQACADQAMNRFIRDMNSTPVVKCRATSPARYIGRGRGGVLAGPGRLGASPRKVSYSVTTTENSQQVTTSDTTSLGGNVGLQLGPLSGGGSYENGSSREVVAPNSSIGTTKSGETEINPKELFPDVPQSQYAEYPLAIVQNVTSYSYTYSCTPTGGTASVSGVHQVDLVTSADVVVDGATGPMTLYSIGM